MPRLGIVNRVSSSEPIHRKVVVRIGELWPRLLRDGALSGLAVAVPCGFHQLIDQSSLFANAGSALDLNDDLRTTFGRWFPRMRAEALAVLKEVA
jgi:hypothetical protein